MAIEESLQAIDFGCKDEIAFGETVNFVRPGFYFGFSPGEEYIGVMALLFGDDAHFIYKRQRLGEIGEFELAR